MPNSRRVVGYAFLLLAVSLIAASGATAGTLITGAEFKDGSLTGTDAKNRSLMAKDLKAESLRGGSAEASPSTGRESDA